MNEELFDVLDASGRKVGQALRRECHGNPALIHPAVHVLVCDHAGRLFLQKRSSVKDIQPRKWDTSVGGHPRCGEEAEAAARREMREELGVEPPCLEPLYHYLWRSAVETEFVTSFRAVHEGPFNLQPEEIETGRFWTAAEIDAALGSGLFTPNFEYEWARFQGRARVGQTGPDSLESGTSTR